MRPEVSRQSGRKVKWSGIFAVAILMDEISVLVNSPITTAGFLGKDSTLCFNKESNEPETRQSAEAKIPLQAGEKYSEGDAASGFNQAGKWAQEIDWL